VLEPLQFLPQKFCPANGQGNGCHRVDSLTLQPSVQGLQ